MRFESVRSVCIVSFEVGVGIESLMLDTRYRLDI